MTLLDPNPTVLAHASRRLAPKKVSTVEADVLKPLPVEGPFDSAALNYVLHCLPGPQPHKAAAIRNVAAVLTPEGVLFGGTVLGASERHTRLARASLWVFNCRGVFDNLEDTEEGLRRILEESFHTVRSTWSAPSHNSRPPVLSEPTRVGEAPGLARARRLAPSAKLLSDPQGLTICFARPVG